MERAWGATWIPGSRPTTYGWVATRQCRSATLVPLNRHPSPDSLRETLLEMATRMGFTRARITPVSAPGPGSVAFDAMVRSRRTATMDWMATGAAARRHPEQLLAGARSALVLGMDYAWQRPPDPGGLTGMVSRYAWGRDYHNLISKRLRKLTRALRTREIESYWSVDARPLVERAWAQQAGLGYVGRNCMVIEPGRGSWFFLGVVLVAADVQPDPPLAHGIRRHCGRCTRCHEQCPTSAFTGDGQLDAAACISMLTIEHRATIPEAFARRMGRWVFGCDVCQEVCPHNHRPPTPLEEDFAPRPGHAWLDLARIMQTDDKALTTSLQGSPLRRPKAWGLKRNAIAVLANIGSPEARRELLRGLDHPHPVVQAQARQALHRIDGVMPG